MTTTMTITLNNTQKQVRARNLLLVVIERQKLITCVTANKLFTRLKYRRHLVTHAL